MKYNADELCEGIESTLDALDPNIERAAKIQNLLDDVRAALKERDEKIEELQLEMLAMGETDE